MINTNKLRGMIVERGFSQRDVAKALNINEMTFYRKMKKGIFSNVEIELMISLLAIDDPCSVFFAPDVS